MSKAGIAPRQRILFVELLGGIGDVLIALPAIQALGRSYPQAQVTVFTFAPGGELLQTDPLIHQVVYADGLGPASGQRNHPCQSLAGFLANNAFDLIISDTNYDSIGRLIQQTGAPRTVTNLWRSPPPDQFVGDRFLEILFREKLIKPPMLPPRLHLSEAERQQAQQALAGITRPLVCLIADAGMAVKRWAIANFVTLGKTLHSNYGASILVPVGSDRDQAIQLAREIGHSAHLWPRSPLRNLAAVLACADLVVAADTGAARIAVALEVPTITLFGPSWQGRYGQPPPHINLQGYSECPERVIANFTAQRCWYSGVCPFEHWQTCLEDISPADVLTAAAPFLSRKSGSRK